MRINRPLATLAATLAFIGATAASAQNAMAPAKPMAASTKTTTTTHVEKKPLAAPKVTQTTHSTRTAAVRQPSGRLVTVKTTTGKTITYDCGKAGNKNKKACRG